MCTNCRLKPSVQPPRWRHFTVSRGLTLPHQAADFSSHRDPQRTIHFDPPDPRSRVLTWSKISKCGISFIGLEVSSPRAQHTAWCRNDVAFCSPPLVTKFHGFWPFFGCSAVECRGCYHLFVLFFYFWDGNFVRHRTGHFTSNNQARAWPRIRADDQSTIRGVVQWFDESL